jgi:hypothetical protein
MTMTKKKTVKATSARKTQQRQSIKEAFGAAMGAGVGALVGAAYVRDPRAFVKVITDAVTQVPSLMAMVNSGVGVGVMPSPDMHIPPPPGARAVAFKTLEEAMCYQTAVKKIGAEHPDWDFRKISDAAVAETRQKYPPKKSRVTPISSARRRRAAARGKARKPPVPPAPSVPPPVQ